MEANHVRAGVQALEVSLLGGVSIRAHGRALTAFRSQTEIAMLAYLAHTGQTHSRETLADLLWEARTTQQSLSNLRTALTRLRKQGGDQLIITRKTVAITPLVHEQTDSTRLRTLLEAAGLEASVTAVNLTTRALDLYRGEFMSGFSLPNAPRFNDWLLVEQEHLRQIALRGYRQLAGWQEEQGAFSAGVATAQQWVAWDPLDETAQQQLMRSLARNGRVSEALLVYEKCRELLRVELALDPAPATTDLYESILAGTLQPLEIAPIPLHNLPRPLTPLIGRAEEIALLTTHLLDPTYPLVSITGAGGMGKTSLALAVARQLFMENQHPFQDGIWFIPLEVIENDSPLQIRETAAALIGGAIGMFFHGESNLWSQLLGQLAAKKMLLILDNIEQFLPVASSLIMDLLAAGPDIRLLVTSRTTVPLASGLTFPLAGLEIPAEESAAASQNESVRLFAERAARTRASIDLEEHLEGIIAICRFVEGMPLGIELAAASLGRLMLDEIMPALTGNVRLLETARLDLPPRQRTLQAVFDYSYQLLDERERAVLAQVSVFRGGFTRQAAEAVLDGPSSRLFNLLDHALLQRSETGRFSMHPLVRQLAQEKLNQSDMSDRAQQALARHSAYYAAFIQSLEDDLRRGINRETMHLILPEQANLHAAWRYAVQAGEWPLIARSLAGMHLYHRRRALFVEEAVLLDDAASVLRATTQSVEPDSAVLLSRLLTARAWGHKAAARFDEGLETAEQALELAQLLHDPELEGQARLAQARLLSTQHKREPALSHFEQVVALAQTAQNPFLEADGWIGIGGQLIWQEDAHKTQESLHHALDLCQALQYRSGEMETLRYMGTMASRQENYAASADYHKQALTLSRLLGDVAAEAQDLGSVGVISELVGDLTGAQIYEREALAIFRRLHMPETEGWMLGQLGYISVRLGDHATGEQLLAEALAIATRLEDNFWQGWVKLRLGEMWYERGEAEKALPLIFEAYGTAEKFQYLNFRARVLYDWGNALLSQAAWAGAQGKYQEAFDLRRGSGRIEQALPALAGLAMATYQQAQPQRAAAHAERLWQYWQESPAWAARADLRLYWHLGTVWDGLEDLRAVDLWQRARALLHERGEKLSDTAARQMFLEQVPAHRAILSSRSTS